MQLYGHILLLHRFPHRANPRFIEAPFNCLLVHFECWEPFCAKTNGVDVQIRASRLSISNAERIGLKLLDALLVRK